MRYLYIFPHPDDESYGPARAMAYQVKQGHEVYLLTLTKGGATKQRHKYNYSVEEMGEVRHKEMLCVKDVLGLTELAVLDMPDSGLKEMDPREIEQTIKANISRIKPDIVVSYPAYGISGFDDHLVTHAVVKRVYLEMKDAGAEYLKRLAFFTLSREDAENNEKNPFNIKGSPPELIDCVVKVEEEDIEKMREALNCYVTYMEVIEKTGIKENISGEVYFEIFGEDHKPPLSDLAKGI